MLLTQLHSIEELLALAIEKRASDVHIEPQRTGIKVRFRVDGLLQIAFDDPSFKSENFISRIKILGNMNITEHRVPQDGHFEFIDNSITHNIRVSSMPTLYGEALVLRIHNQKSTLIDIRNVGFDNTQLMTLVKLITTPSGIILITGPTGSGKTNLLYSILEILNTPQKNVVTLEDPIEFQLDGIRQVQINEATGLSFSRAMRAVVRQDPNIIMLGEIRDSDTAQMAFQASLMGMLVFATFHTFDVPALLSRFMELGVSNTLLSQSLRAVILSRLMRKICDQCKVEQNISPEDARVLHGLQIDHPVYKGTGCPACNKSGYKGRTGVFEITLFNTAIKKDIIDGKPLSTLEDTIAAQGASSVKQQAMLKVAQGITTLEEYRRVFGLI